VVSSRAAFLLEETRYAAWSREGARAEYDRAKYDR
jgi:hypothetical protein